jgi:hypothetical protein
MITFCGHCEERSDAAIHKPLKIQVKMDSSLRFGMTTLKKPTSSQMILVLHQTRLEKSNGNRKESCLESIGKPSRV